MCIYRLHFCDATVFLEEFSNLLSAEKGSNLILTGDFNIDILTSSQISDSYLALIAEYGLLSFINESTRPLSGSCLDHVVGRFSSYSADLFIAVNFDLGISDHSMTGGVLSNIELVKQIKSNNFEIKKIQFEELNNELFFENWFDVYVEDNANKAYSFLNILQSHLQTFTLTTRDGKNRPV